MDNSSPRIRIHNQAAYRKFSAGFNIGAAQKGTHPHEQFAEINGLDHIIINSQVKSLLFC